jgi:hypothetical protein
MEIRLFKLSPRAQFSFSSLIGQSRKLLLIPALMLAFASVSFAQVKYTPEHEDVYASATRGVNYLQEHLPGETGEAILAGIATIEYTKRYENSVPVDHPTVQHALNRANAAMVDPMTPLRNDHSMYAPCLAIILYCDCGDQKYKAQIQELIGALLERQSGDGSFGYFGQEGIGDTSQTQYAALAMWVAKAHGFRVPPQAAKKTLEWLCRSKAPENSWYYNVRNYAAFGGNKDFSQSIHCSGLSTVYLLGDYLQLTPNRRKNQQANSLTGLELPPSVSIYVEPKDGEERKSGPLIGFDRGLLGGAKAGGNKWLANNWTVNSERWNYYYLYALERYAFFRETAEGVVKEIPTWYDQGVEHLFSQQDGGGSWPGGGEVHESGHVNTALAVMFLVRASQVLVMEGGSGLVRGNKGFELDKTIKFNKDGTVTSRDAIKGVEDVMSLLKDGGADEDPELVLAALGTAISEMSSKTDKSRNEQVAFLRSMLEHPKPSRRIIAVKLLAGVQDIDNAPALIYALGDPVLDVQIEAHNGLRLVSRKIDSIEISDNPNAAEFAALKKQWTEWYLGINPGAELLD